MIPTTALGDGLTRGRGDVLLSPPAGSPAHAIAAR
jgi:hypothetical protein